MANRNIERTDGDIFDPKGTAPGSPYEGQVYYDDTLNALRVWNGTSWVEGGVPDCSGSVAGKVNLSPQTMGQGVKTFANIISPTVYNTNGNGASDIVLKLGTTVADASLQSDAKIFSVRTSIGGTEVEKMYMGSNGNVVIPQTNVTSAFTASTDGAPAIVGNGGLGGGTGVRGNAYGGYGIHGVAQNSGVCGESTANHGVLGKTTGVGAAGVRGYSSAASGIPGPGSDSPGVQGESTNYFGIVALDNGGTGAPLKITPKAALEDASHTENGAVSILTDGTFNWRGNGSWNTAAKAADLSSYALKSGATFTGEIVVPDVKYTPGVAPTPAEGQVYYDSTDDVLRFRNASTWVDCGGIGSIPDASASQAGKVNLLPQTLGAGAKTVDQLITPIVNNINGAGSSDIIVKLGTSVADITVSSSAKLISLRTGIGGTEAEKLSVLKSGSLTSASSLVMLSDSSAPVSPASGVSFRANTGVLEVSQNGGDYTTISGATVLDIKDSVRATTAAALNSYTRTGNIINSNANQSLFPVDGVTLVVGDRLLNKNGVSGTDNGIYRVVQTTAPYQLIRTNDADTSAKVTSGMCTFTTEGTANGRQGFILITADPIVLNTTNLTISPMLPPDASETLSGVVTTGAQTFGGSKIIRQLTLSPSSSVQALTINGRSDETNVVQILGNNATTALQINCGTGTYGIYAQGQATTSTALYATCMGLAVYGISTGTTTSGRYGVKAESAGNYAALMVVPRASLPSTPENGAISILNDGSFNWYGSGAWKKVVDTTGAAFTGVISTTGLINQSGTIDATPNPTVNKPTGICTIASGATTCVVTNSLATTTSRVMITWYGDHGASRSWVTRAAGSFTVNLPEAASADTAFGWEVSTII